MHFFERATASFKLRLSAFLYSHPPNTNILHQKQNISCKIMRPNSILKSKIIFNFSVNTFCYCYLPDTYLCYPESIILQHATWFPWENSTLQYSLPHSFLEGADCIHSTLESYGSTTRRIWTNECVSKAEKYFSINILTL